MAEPRLTGRLVRAVRNSISVGPIADALWAFSSRDFHLPELHRLPDSKLAPLDPAPVPLQARPPRQWVDAALAPPAVTGERTTGRALRAAFSAGSTTPVEVLERVLRAHGMLAERSPFIALDVPRARRAAQASTERWKSDDPRGPLDGLIVPLKDEFHMTGLPTRGGTAYQETPQTTDAWVVECLEAAGAIVLGKAHAVEWGLNPNGVVEHFKVPRNVYSDEHGAGGSSLGSAVATALGLCPSSVGTDGGGSIRIPACLNGVFGLKPTYVRVGRTGDIWGASTVAHIGPIGQSTEDCVDQLEATAGVDPRDPLTTWAPDVHDPRPWRAALGRGVEGARIGLCRSELEDAEPTIAEAVIRAVEALENEGAIVVDVELPLGAAINGVGALTIGGETAGNLREDLANHGELFGDELAILLRMMSRVTVADFMLAARVRAWLRRAMVEIFETVDLLALPTTARPASRYALDEDLTAVLDTAATASVTRFNFLGNLTGLPAGQVPIGSMNGLPIGLQLVGDAWDEASVIAAMAHCERIGLTDVIDRPAGFVRVLG